MRHGIWDFPRTARIYVDGFMERYNCKLIITIFNTPQAVIPQPPLERVRVSKAFQFLELARLVIPLEHRQGHESSGA